MAVRHLRAVEEPNGEIVSLVSKIDPECLCLIFLRSKQEILFTYL